MKFKIPSEVSHITETLQKNKFEAYLIGGCVRDLLRNKKPKDWDVTTNANPEQIQELFSQTFYENDFGTVGVVQETKDETLKVVEVTPYRLEAKYTDKRRPDKVEFSGKLEDDLKRRDFTMNALAYNPRQDKLVDLFNGEDDIKNKTIRTVGEPGDRFDEDALRIMRAIRLSVELGFEIEKKTAESLINSGKNLQKIAIERIQQEFSRIIMSSDPMRGITLLHEHEILQFIAPEIEDGLGIEQNGDHIYNVWEHNLRASKHAADNMWPLHIRLAALFHDVAKPETRQWSKEKNDWTFYGHDVVGGRKVRAILKRLKHSNDMIDRVGKLVRWHLFFSDIDVITLSAVRRLVRNVGPENVWDLMKVRACDRIGMGRPKEKPYRLRKYESMIEEAVRAPVSVGMLNIDGDIIMKITGEKPGYRIGYILHALLEEVLDDPERNTKENLLKRTLKLQKLPKKELEKLGKKGKNKREETEEREITEIRKRHYVK